MIKQAATKGKAAGQKLVTGIRNQPVVHADETSWREGGEMAGCG